ncbi:MAG TPA: hypothetical protein VMW58_05025, partial [Anaerolineae bacterium]|nr:hypothetical protein [Anaerolineae bacterium]
MSKVLKTAWLVCMVVILAVTACSVAPASPTDEPTIAPDDTPTPTTIVSPDEMDWEDRTVFGAGLVSTEQAVLEDLAGATVYHIDLLIPEDFNALEGHQELLYTNREVVALEEIYFRLFVNTSGGRATVSEVEVDGQAVE